MLHTNNYFQLEHALILFLFGILAGIIYSLFHPNIAIFKNKIFIIVSDTITTIISGTLLILATNIVNFGIYRLYLIISFMIGYYIERKTIGKMFAKINCFVYNLLSKVISFVCKTKIYKLITKWVGKNYKWLKTNQGAYNL